MKLAFCSVCLENHSFEEMMTLASGNGYRALELIAIPDWIHVDLRHTQPNELKAKVEAHGMELVGLYPGGVDTASDATIEKCLAYIRKTIGVAKTLGVERLVFTGADREEGKESRLEAAIEALSSLVPALEDAGVTLCLENHYRNQFEFPENYERLFETIASPNVAMTVDTGHFTSSQVDLLKLVDRFGERIRHVHLKDHIGTQSVAIGHGETDNRGFLKKLNQSGFDGYVSLELEVKDYENVERYIAEAKGLVDGYIAAACA